MSKAQKKITGKGHHKYDSFNLSRKSIVLVVSLPSELAIMCTDANEGAMRTHHMTLKRQ